MSSTKTAGPKNSAGALTVDQIESDRITKLSESYWAYDAQDPLPFNRNIVDEIYQQEIIKTNFNVRRIMMLEFSQYLENFLWKYYDEQASHFHMMSITVMVNEKFRERVPAWDCFVNKPENFSHFFRKVLEALLEPSTKRAVIKEQTVLLVFLAYCFNSLEVDIIRREIQLLIGLPIWTTLLPSLREELLNENPKLRKMWRAFTKQYEQMNEKERAERDFSFRFFDKMISRYFDILESADTNFELEKVHWLERFAQLIVDCLSLLPTRRFLNILLGSRHFCTRNKLSEVLKKSDANLLNQLLDRLNFYAYFEIDDLTGEPLTEGQVMDIHYDKVGKLQRAAFNHFNQSLSDFALANVSAVDERENLVQYLRKLQLSDLRRLTEVTHLLPVEEEKEKLSKQFLLEIIIASAQRRKSQIDTLNDMPLYPTEQVIWDMNVVPTEFYSGVECLSLPKLNLQFLSLHDYLLRNFELFRLESTYEIREDIQDALKRIKPYRAENGGVYCGGQARMALPIVSFSVVQVGKPLLGEIKPGYVKAEITINVGNMRNDTRNEWESLKRHDVIFLAALKPEKPIGDRFDYEKFFPEEFGVRFIRGAEVEGLVMEDGYVYEEGLDSKPTFSGNNRTFRVFLDTAQYQMDSDKLAEQGSRGDDPYKQFAIVIRRNPKENNFKAVLDTIRDLMNVKCVVPDWLHDVILGFGDPASAHFSNLPNQIERLDWCDTFLDFEHLKASFPQYKFEGPNLETSKPPYRLTIPAGSGYKGEREKYADEKTIMVEPYEILNRGPYPTSAPKTNQVRFTPTQVEAIRSGVQPGLTMIVGPPGTGKTDVAVQIISNIYHNFPNERTVIVTHSNQALNQLFEKIMQLDIDERHLLRMGHGEELLETEKDFSRYGRVNYVLAQRLELLNEVKRLQDSLGVGADVAYTCETAGYFYLCEVLRRWEQFLAKTNGKDNVAIIQETFPFTKYFENAPQPLFKGNSFHEDFEIAQGCFRHIKNIFTQLEEFRAFELIRNGADRAKYLLVKEAKIIAMTCTHAALKRRDLVQALFQYDNILMEESAQILEIETFIPLLLQNPDRGRSRLKRWIMIGDHHQLPPIIQNMAFQKFSNMEQSLFTRFVRLGVPTVNLDAQGRARPSLCQLYTWRYEKLDNLPHVLAQPEFQVANPGFLYDYQLIDVQDFEGQGESEPSPHFIQNLAEAEYVVGVFMYMRLVGYPANKITILTTYNGQKQLIRDVLQRRCALNPVFGQPHKIATVDKYQGQQNDYILLSLVRTKQVGHLRDVRRLIVAMSRARLGLYVFGRAKLFSNCFELTPVFNQLSQRPTKLQLLPSEAFPAQRLLDAAPLVPAMAVEDMPTMAHFVYGFYQQRVAQMVAEAEKVAKLEQEKARILQESDRRIREDSEFEIPSDNQLQQKQQQRKRKQPAKKAPSPEPLPPGAESDVQAIEIPEEEEDEEEHQPPKEASSEEESDNDMGDSITNELMDDPEVRKRLEEEERIRKAAKKGKKD